ncbi:MAG: 2-phosphosulfolactate phosphatase [Flavobacteriales bacterium]|nr:2-phosphosulfolactate phosphatase [Flavobacteriales bacterium]
MAQIEVCFTPEQFSFYENDDAVAVVIDVFRATSAMCVAFDNGMKEIIPVERVEEAIDYKKKGYLVAAERKGEVVEGFNLGNSPFHYMNSDFVGQTLVITTTNGTRAIKTAGKRNEVVIGSFLNLEAVCTYLKEQNKDVILVCAGWKGRFNLEDSLFAGAVVSKLMGFGFFPEMSDSSIACKHFYEMASGDLCGFLANSSHRRRLGTLNLDKDIEYCLQESVLNVLPILKNGRLVNALKA